jgi:hypothetical protein
MDMNEECGDAKSTVLAKHLFDGNKEAAEDLARSCWHQVYANSKTGSWAFIMRGSDYLVSGGSPAVDEYLIKADWKKQELERESGQKGKLSVEMVHFDKNLNWDKARLPGTLLKITEQK